VAAAMAAMDAFSTCWRRSDGHSSPSASIAIAGASLPVAYGPARASGNELLNYQLSDNSRVILRILGEGVWDGIDRLWINGKLVDITDVNAGSFP
jgi:hypothetical protein